MEDLETQMADLLERANTSGVDDDLLDEFAELDQQMKDQQQQTAQAANDDAIRARLSKMTPGERIAEGLKQSRPGQSLNAPRRRK